MSSMALLSTGSKIYRRAKKRETLLKILGGRVRRGKISGILLSRREKRREERGERERQTSAPMGPAAVGLSNMKRRTTLQNEEEEKKAEKEEEKGGRRDLGRRKNDRDGCARERDGN